MPLLSAVGISGLQAGEDVKMKNLRTDPMRDLTPVTTMFSTPFYLVVNNSIPVKTVQELIDYAKARPGKLTYASLGRGGTHHLTGEMFRQRAGIDILHVPYKGSAPAMNDLLGGQVDMMFEGGASTFPYVQSGRLRALASTGPKRTHAMPDLPALTEFFPGLVMSAWIALVGPRGLPQDVIDTLTGAVQAMLKLPSTEEKFGPLGVETMPGTQADFLKLIQSEIPVLTKLVQDAGVEPQ